MESNNAYPPYNQAPPPGEDSYASRSAQAYGSSNAGAGVNVGNQQQHQQMQPPQPQLPEANQGFQQPQISTTVPPVSHKPSSYSYQTSQSSTQQVQALQQNLLEASIRRMQESTHIMRGAMDADDLPTTLDRAAAMLGELGDPKHHHHHHHANQGHNSHSQIGHSSSTAIMSPKHYYEIHMLAMEELPNIEEYLLSLSSGPSARYAMKDLYEITQYTSRSVPRLYLQICAGSALIRSGEEDATIVLNDLIQAVKCVQCPIRGLFLRDYLLKAVRDKLPDEVDQDDNDNQLDAEETKESTPAGYDANDVPMQTTPVSATLTSLMGDLTMDINSSVGFLADNSTSEDQTVTATPQENTPGINTSHNVSLNSPGRVKDSYQFVLANFIEMNKLWVRIQHLPGDLKNKDTKRRRERERNELRMMVGTNLVRLSELEGVTSAIYGTVILPRILDQIIACRDPLAQAYLMDCIIQVFPDEFHIQTLEVILNVCPKLRDKVNVRTILQSIMDRLSNYYADELLLNDEEDTEGVKTSVMLDSFEMFDECIRSVFEARGAKISAKEVIRLESSLLDFSLKCYPARMDYFNKCLGVCASCLRGEGTSHSALVANSGIVTPIPMDEVAVKELEALLSLPLETMGLNVLDLDQYSELLSFLPLDHRKRVAMELLNVLYLSGENMTEINEIEQLFAIIAPLIRSDNTNNNTNNASTGTLQERESISKLIHLLYNEDTDVHFDILNFVKKYLFFSGGAVQISSYTVAPLFFSAMKLLDRVQIIEFPKPKNELKEENLKFEDEFKEEEEDFDEEVHEEKQVENGKEVDSENDRENVVDVENDDEDKIVIQEDEKVNSSSTITISNEQKEDDLENDVGDVEIVENNHCEEGEQDNAKDGQTEVAEAFNDVPVKLTSENEEVEDNPKELEDDSDSNTESKSLSPSVEEETSIDEIMNKTANEVVGETVESDGIGGADKTEISSEAPKQTEAEDSLFESEDIVQTSPVFSKLTNCRKIFLFVQKLLSFVEMTNPDLCFSLRLQATTAANRCAIISTEHKDKSDFSPIAYEFMSEAFLTYEAEITDSSAQKNAMIKMIGILLSCECFETTDYEALITKTTQYAARLLKKTDQCSMVLMCSHLFFKNENVYQNPKRVLECLQRALKLADVCTTASPANLQLFVDIFDKYVYFFEKGNPYISDKFITGLVALINEHINSVGTHHPSVTAAKEQFTQIVSYIENKKTDPAVGEKFVTISLP